MTAIAAAVVHLPGGLPLRGPPKELLPMPLERRQVYVLASN